MKDLIQPRPDDPSRSYLVRMERHRARGDYSYAPRGSVHEAIRSDEGALLFIVETA